MKPKIALGKELRVELVSKLDEAVQLLENQGEVTVALMLSNIAASILEGTYRDLAGIIESFSSERFSELEAQSN